MMSTSVLVLQCCHDWVILSSVINIVSVHMCVIIAIYPTDLVSTVTAG